MSLGGGLLQLLFFSSIEQCFDNVAVFPAAQWWPDELLAIGVHEKSLESSFGRGVGKS